MRIAVLIAVLIAAPDIILWLPAQLTN